MNQINSGGGVAIIYRSVFKSMKMTALPTVKSFEYVSCTLKASNNGKFVLFSIYGPGSQPLLSEFFTELTSSWTYCLNTAVLFGCLVNIHVEQTLNEQVI